MEEKLEKEINTSEHILKDFAYSDFTSGQILKNQVVIMEALKELIEKQNKLR